MGGFVAVVTVTIGLLATASHAGRAGERAAGIRFQDVSLGLGYRNLDGWDPIEKVLYYVMTVGIGFADDNWGLVLGFGASGDIREDATLTDGEDAVHGKIHYEEETVSLGLRYRVAPTSPVSAYLSGGGLYRHVAIFRRDVSGAIVGSPIHGAFFMDIGDTAWSFGGWAEAGFVLRYLRDVHPGTPRSYLEPRSFYMATSGRYEYVPMHILNTRLQAGGLTGQIMLGMTF